MISYLDKVVLQFFVNSEAVGYYTAGYRIGGFILMIANSVGALFFPLFSQAFAAGDHEYIRDRIYRFERFSYLFIMPGVILIVIYSAAIVRVILGPQYGPSIQAMALVTLAMFVTVHNMPYGNVITGKGHFKTAAVVNTANLVFFLIVLLLLVNPKYMNLGPTGAALTLLASNLFLGVSFRVIAKNICPVLTFGFELRFISFGVISYLAASFIYNACALSSGVAYQVIFVPAFLVLTYVLYYFMGWMDRSDLSRVLSVFNIRSMKEYIRGEIRSR
jgi:O-antigen/teichoic acid export membrane protein